MDDLALAIAELDYDLIHRADIPGSVWLRLETRAGVAELAIAPAVLGPRRASGGSIPSPGTTLGGSSG